MKALRDYSSQARHHFTQANQVNQLVSASEADPDLGFMARMMALCSLPRTNPGNRLQYKRVNGPYTLIMTAVGQTKLPYGNLPRLLLAWICTKAVRTQTRELVLGASLSEFMRKLGLAPIGGGSRGERMRLRNQMKRLFNAHIQLAYEGEQVSASVNSPVASRTGFWWNERKTSERLGAVGEQDRTGREVLPRDHPPPRAAGYEYPEGPQALFAGHRFLPVVDLSDLHAEAPTAPFLAASLPSVRSGPGQGGRQPYRGQLPHGLLARIKEDQGGLAGSELCGGQGRTGPFSLETCCASPCGSFDYATDFL